VLGLGVVMKEQMRHIYKVMLITAAIMLQACGGSGDKTVFSISADISEAKFNIELLQESTSTIAIDVNFEGDGLVVGFAPENDPVSWLEYRAENVTENSATILIDVTNFIDFINDNNEIERGALPTDTYTTKIRIATSNEDSSKFASHDIDVSLLVWSLVDKQKVKYSGTFGDASIPSQTLSISSGDNEWTANADVDWLSLDVTSGTVDSPIVVTADISSFTMSGLQQGNIIITEATSGITKTVPVELALDNVYLLAERPAVALTSTTTISAFTTTVSISNNSEHAISWQASTAADWLTVSSIDENHLQITADPNSAPLNETSSAEVLVSASQDTTVISDTIKVNFYNSDLPFENKVLTALEINNDEMLASPIMPQFYVSVGNQLLTYHQYTGEVETSLVVSPEGTALDQLIMHPTGNYLLAKAVETVTDEDEITGDVTTSEVTHRYRVNLLDSSITEILDGDILFEPIDIIRLDGRYFVVTQALEFADENLQVLFWDSENAYLSSEIEVAAQTNTIFALDNNQNTNLASFKRYIPQINDFGDDQISTSLTHDYHPESLLEGQFVFDFIVTNDEANIYAVSETSEWLSFDGENFVDNGLLETNENVVTLFLEKNKDSQPSFLRFDSSNALGFYLDMYDDQQMISSTIFTQGSQPSSIELSSDNQRLIINVDSSSNPEVDSQVELVTISP
jgi:hypothetical protein